MEIAYSVLVKDNRTFDRITYLYRYFPLEINLVDYTFIQNNGVGDITDPLVDIENIIGLKIAPVKKKEELLDYLEKNIIIAEELKCNRIVYPISDMKSYVFFKKYMDEIFKLFSNYNTIFIVEPGNIELLVKSYNNITEYIGGIYRISLNINALKIDTPNILRYVQNYFRIVDSIKISDLDIRGNPARILSSHSILNVPLILNFLIRLGYEKYLVINYEENGLLLNVKEIIDDMRKIDELSKSFMKS